MLKNLPGRAGRVSAILFVGLAAVVMIGDAKNRNLAKIEEIKLKIKIKSVQILATNVTNMGSPGCPGSYLGRAKKALSPPVA
ncbi:MAG: hypothetical protein ACOZHQ_01815 [Thermodesulfobacteriota bacterium]